MNQRSAPPPTSSSESSATSKTLLRQVQNREQSAWARLVEVYSPLVYRTCRVAGLQAHDAGDVVQQVFISVLRSIHTFEPRPGGSFRAWLLTITKNKIRDFYRKLANTELAIGGSEANRHLQALRDLSWDSSSDGRSINSSVLILQRVIGCVRGDFQEKTWQAFWRVTVEGQPAADVAQQLRLSKWSVYQAKSRVLQRIRQAIEDLGEES